MAIFDDNKVCSFIWFCKLVKNIYKISMILFFFTVLILPLFIDNTAYASIRISDSSRIEFTGSPDMLMISLRINLFHQINGFKTVTKINYLPN